jgi:hypothetical protein
LSGDVRNVVRTLEFDADRSRCIARALPHRRAGVLKALVATDDWKYSPLRRTRKCRRQAAMVAKYDARRYRGGSGTGRRSPCFRTRAAARQCPMTISVTAMSGAPG